MLHTKFRGNRPAGSGGKGFRRVFTIYGCGGHLGIVTIIMSSDFHFLLTFRSMAAIVSEKSTIFTFSCRKA